MAKKTTINLSPSESLGISKLICGLDWIRPLDHATAHFQVDGIA